MPPPAHGALRGAADNDEKKALWERNYLMGHNKLIGGVFLMQARGQRLDNRNCETRFSLFCRRRPPSQLRFRPALTCCRPQIPRATTKNPALPALVRNTTPLRTRIISRSRKL